MEKENIIVRNNKRFPTNKLPDKGEDLHVRSKETWRMGRQLSFSQKGLVAGLWACTEKYNRYRTTGKGRKKSGKQSFFAPQPVLLLSGKHTLRK